MKTTEGYKWVSKADGRICEVPVNYQPPAGYKLVSTGKGWEKEVRGGDYVESAPIAFFAKYNAVPCDVAGNPFYPPQVSDSTLITHANGAISGWDAGCRTPTQRRDMKNQMWALIARGLADLASEIQKRLYG
jgi:hypothetical protein